MSLLLKLGELLIGSYKLQKGEVMFIQAELESMKGVLEKISSTPRDQLDNQDRIWAKNLRELSYDIEDSVDTFMVCGKGSELARPQGFKMFTERCCNLLTQFRIRRSTACEIRGIKRRIVEVCNRRARYKIDVDVAKPVTVDPRLFSQYLRAAELVGIDETRNDVIKILMQQDKIVSIIGFGGLGKTTLANAVYEKIKGQFDCSAFVSVSQTPDMNKLVKDMFYQLTKNSYESITLVNELREFLENKRYELSK